MWILPVLTEAQFTQPRKILFWRSCDLAHRPPANSLVANPKAEWLMRRVKTLICYIQFDSKILIRKEGRKGQTANGRVEARREGSYKLHTNPYKLQYWPVESLARTFLCLHGISRGRNWTILYQLREQIWRHAFSGGRLFMQPMNARDRKAISNLSMSELEDVRVC